MFAGFEEAVQGKTLWLLWYSSTILVEQHACGLVDFLFA